MACNWIFISWISLSFKIDGPNTLSWINSNTPPFNTLDNMRLYFVSYYYTISTITFVGYGDIVGLNTLERLVAIVNEVIGVIIFSVIISKLSNIVMLID